MSSSRYPLYNIRKNAYGVWQQIHETGESVTVPGSASEYCVRLKEVPDNGSVHTKPVISELSRAELYPPSAGQFWVNYATGDLVFSSELEGNTYSVDYWQRGSLIDAQDINLLYNRIIEMTRDPVATDDGYEIGTLWVNTLTNNYFICTNNTDDNAIWNLNRTGYKHEQVDPEIEWTVTHNLNYKYLNINVYDTTDEIIIPYRIRVINENTMVITFPEAMSGVAVLSF